MFNLYSNMMLWSTHTFSPWRKSSGRSWSKLIFIQASSFLMHPNIFEFQSRISIQDVPILKCILTEISNTMSYGLWKWNAFNFSIKYLWSFKPSFLAFNSSNRDKSLTTTKNLQISLELRLTVWCLMLLNRSSAPPLHWV